MVKRVPYWICLCVGPMLLAVGMVRADVVAYWHFNGMPSVLHPPGTVIGADQGSGTMTSTFNDIRGNSGAATSLNALPGVGAGLGLLINNPAPAGATLTFAFSTVGAEDLIMSFAANNSSGNQSGSVSYSSDGGSGFTPFGSFTPILDNNGFSLHTFDFSAVATLDNNPNVQIRITSTSLSTDTRFDNILFDATSFAEACCLVNGACANLGPGDCTVQGGTTQGPGTSCAGFPDGDGDGSPDLCDLCDTDPGKTQPGQCGCGVSDDDSDSDAVPDCDDVCPGFDDSLDCNINGTPDGCDIAGEFSRDVCPMNGIPDECETARWIGVDGASFTQAGNWSTGQSPNQGSDLLLWMDSPGDNHSVADVRGDLAVCSLRVQGANGGRQFLEVLAGTTLYVEERFSNAESGTIDVRSLSRLIVPASEVWQAGEFQIRTNAGASYAGDLTNADGGLITLLGGSLAAASLTNAAGGTVSGFGTIDGDTINDGNMVAIADMQIVGDLANNGTIMIQGGVLTITGSLSGSGTIIGGFEDP